MSCFGHDPTLDGGLNDAIFADFREKCGPWGPIKYIEVLRGVLGTCLPSLVSISATVVEKIAFEVRKVGKMACSISMHFREEGAFFSSCGSLNIDFITT